ncbi:2-oxo acid dehydrogenase subunit E2 [Nakamurella antarctica]|uniref:Dihydrolipoamide acetyltransferase component of pyruvate dehydrogenase complex n=1 Tax=Nakamurella antarctica TaxID=1902245 RepID=A0A3G8ZQR6_9ACTN|nr:dihydrolipoamide acetyltransferase family protein [Nakamurella antarctica]AZI59147.1 2-oxo acid dehydrogenase subunit E2 [Nakamurella antarctica]
MAIESFNLPDVGEGLTEAEILGWRVAVGDQVTINQIIVEIETAKASVELPSPYAGTVTALLVAQGETVDVGTPIIRVETGGAGTGASSSLVDVPGSLLELAEATSASAAAVRAAEVTGAEVTGAEVSGAEVSGAEDEDAGTKIGEMTADGKIATLVGYVAAEGATARRPRRAVAAPSVMPGVMPGVVRAVLPAARPTARVASAEVATAAPAVAVAKSGSVHLAAPPTRMLARELGVDLAFVSATRPDGVISRQDVLAAAGSPASSSENTALAGTALQGAAGLQTRVPIKGVRKMMAAAMVSSAFSAPHVTVFLQVDVTAMMQLRDRVRSMPDFAGLKLTPLVFVAKAVCLAAKRTPDVNAFWDEQAQEIVYQDYVNLGIAAATPRGLIVPNIPGADSLTVKELAQALVELTDTARAGKTSPAQMTGGTFTISNVGVLGVDTGTPIINPGESAILALGSIKDAPWVFNGALAVRKVCQLALSFDHRVVDGEQGARFLADVGAVLEHPGMAMLW